MPLDIVSNRTALDDTLRESIRTDTRTDTPAAIRRYARHEHVLLLRACTDGGHASVI